MKRYVQFCSTWPKPRNEQAALTGPPARAMQVIAQFLDDPIHAPDGSCVAALPPPHFVGS